MALRPDPVDGPRDRLATWGGFALGLLASPLVMLVLSAALTQLYGGLEGPGLYGIAVSDVRRLASALDRYRNRYQHIPDKKEGLAKLAPEFVPQLPLDPWGHPYLYDPSGPSWADVLCYGADGRAGGIGVDADVSARFGRLGARPPGWVRSGVTVLLMGLPIAAAVTGARRRWCATALAGIAAFWGVLLLATVSDALRAAILPPLSFAAGIACLTASVALIRDLAHARLVALIAVAAAYLLLQYLVTS